jgi:hypothetical protein
VCALPATPRCRPRIPSLSEGCARVMACCTIGGARRYTSWLEPPLISSLRSKGFLTRVAVLTCNLPLVVLAGAAHHCCCSALPEDLPRVHVRLEVSTSKCRLSHACAFTFAVVWVPPRLHTCHRGVLWDSCGMACLLCVLHVPPYASFGHLWWRFVCWSALCGGWRFCEAYVFFLMPRRSFVPFFFEA